MDDKNEPMIIPAVPKIPGVDPIIKKREYSKFFILAASCFASWFAMSVVTALLPISLALKILIFLVGSFFVLDIFHSFKKVCQQR